MIDGEDLRALRVQAGITQQEMCKKLGCDRKTIINYELGVSDIPSKKLFRWLQCCKLDLGVLLGQIKAIRDGAHDSSKAKLLDFVTVAFILSQFWSQVIVTPIYLSLLGMSALYGMYIKNINVSHIAGFILVLTTINLAIFETDLVNYVTPDENPLLQGVLIYGIQLLFSLTTALILIFRVQFSRLLSKSDQVELTHFDGIFHWLYLYSSSIYFLALAEEIAYTFFEMKSWTLIYDNFEGLIYIAWALCCGALLTMVICSKKPSNTNELA
ncbi:helix-turn-helix domain-containing protein [Pseudoalteromonas sp. T1lg23B]|uniref:helix-turn-helix domain-containing protein n=1 Tax=Pseudoalteromonas sp. T1lg23B TaxID=2077097 RepID=UPI001F47719F|nr:helix-turn-helix transcriptional regulator [Pseudoalteromonas sp. T1lg23B]